jgi:hypothetical protein
MKERPTWHKGTIEGGKGHVEKTEEEKEMERSALLAAERQFILDSAPDDWESLIEDELLQEYRTEILTWDEDRFLTFARDNDIWQDPTYAKALLDVLSGKIVKPLKSSQ